MYLYEIRNTVNTAVYVGITRNKLSVRWSAHKCSVNRGCRSALYDAVRSLGVDNFYIVEVCSFTNEGDMLEAEKALIKYHRNSDYKCYNILDGGEAYFPIKDWEAHKAKLKIARAGRKPALGMKHTEDNKIKFSKFGKARWDMYGRYPDDIASLSFKDAKTKHGISKTHYYRLRKLAQSNELC